MNLDRMSIDELFATADSAQDTLMLLNNAYVATDSLMATYPDDGPVVALETITMMVPGDWPSLEEGKFKETAKAIMDKLISWAKSVLELMRKIYRKIIAIFKKKDKSETPPKDDDKYEGKTCTIFKFANGARSHYTTTAERLRDLVKGPLKSLVKDIYRTDTVGALASSWTLHMSDAVAYYGDDPSVDGNVLKLNIAGDVLTLDTEFRDSLNGFTIVSENGAGELESQGEFDFSICSNYYYQKMDDKANINDNLSKVLDVMDALMADHTKYLKEVERESSRSTTLDTSVFKQVVDFQGSFKHILKAAVSWKASMDHLVNTQWDEIKRVMDEIESM